ncbi:MAG: DUF262 domain-containing HNH endonuclease family protein [Burkholderiales bacterium]|nr:DUF262 domain-containing HNH endonuclease family protein [Burkholderiales bacterium]
MSQGNEIKSEKILLKDVFNMWFRIPEYQRPYVWGYEEIHDLLDDLTFAGTSRPEAEYFLGSLVFQAKPADKSAGRDFDENDLLDGQQRLTTLLLMLAVIRDLSDDAEIKETCHGCIHQKANKLKRIPERVRIEFHIRENAQRFIDTHIKAAGGTQLSKVLEQLAESSTDASVKNMAKGIATLRSFFMSAEAMPSAAFVEFLLNKVLLIYVATENLEDAFRLFTILNNRGVPLRNSDILKSINLGALESERDRAKYARMWEQAEGELGEDFDRFLAHLRTILVKEKARLNLLQEYEDKIYEPKEKDKTTGQIKPVLLKKGKETFEFVETYLGHYKQLLGGANYNVCESFAFDNLIKVMQTGLPATDWIPPLLAYYKKFGDEQILDFLKKLNTKFAGDWLSQKTPTDRIDAMNDVIKTVDASSTVADVFSSANFGFDEVTFDRVLRGQVYGRRFALYILLILDYTFQNHDQKMHFETLSVEHLLPQNPEASSQWCKDFTDADRSIWTDKLANLVLITRRKNTSQGRLDYVDKKKKYFQKNIDTCPNSLRLLNNFSTWTLTDIESNETVVMGKLEGFFGLKAV